MIEGLRGLAEEAGRALAELGVAPDAPEPAEVGRALASLLEPQRPRRLWRERIRGAASRLAARVRRR